MEGPVHNAYFMPVGPYATAKHKLSATLTVPETKVWPFGKFPGVSVQIFSGGDRLIPVTRDIISADNEKNRSHIIFSPGRVWSEPGDKGLSRASFPFTLTHRIWNRSHSGLATFVFDDSVVSPMVFQIVQENSPGVKFDAWGRLPITLVPGKIDDLERVTAEYEREMDDRLPVRPFEELAAKYGNAGKEVIKHWSKSENESMSGLLVDGVLYVRDCQTRFGHYPYCDEMRHGVYSLTKSLGALVAMLRLAQKFGDQVFNLRIKDYVNVSATHDGWNKVTFADTLNMTTGIGDAPADSDIVITDSFPPYNQFMAQPSAKEKLTVAFTSKNYPWGPGQVIRYRSMDTFILAAAMDGYLKSQEGPTANIWDMVLEEVLRPIGVFHAPMIHTIEPDGSRGIPILGEGLYPTYHDIAKISLLLQNDGKHRNKQLLSAKKLREALYQTEIRGKPIPASSHISASSYHLSFWQVPIQLQNCRIIVPRMSGWGGNTVLLLPSGAVAFIVQDGGVSRNKPLIAAATLLRPECH
ncbi:MAG: beta-lactamase family protein [Gammaproteobacteria bacterium]|nr:beta-lactamase family protein [Gammaproteobacteria bacterium]